MGGHRLVRSKATSLTVALQRPYWPARQDSLISGLRILVVGLLLGHATDLRVKFRFGDDND